MRHGRSSRGRWEHWGIRRWSGGRCINNLNRRRETGRFRSWRGSSRSIIGLLLFRLVEMESKNMENLRNIEINC